MLLKVLIADDESYIVSTLVNTIDWTKLGMEVYSTADNGTDALSIVRSASIDIVITDIRMPGITGLELCQELFQYSPQTAVIVISGYADFAYAQRAMKYGVIGYCLKPVEFSELEGFLLRAALRLRKNQIVTQDDLLEAIENGETVAISKLLERFEFPFEAFHGAVVIGERNLNLAQHHLHIPLARDRQLILAPDPISTNHIREAIDTGDIKSIGLSHHTLHVNTLHCALDSCIAKSYQFFINENSSICYRLPLGKDHYFIDRLSAAVTHGDHGQMIKTLNEISDSEYGSIFTIKSAVKICNILFSSRKFICEMEDMYVYSFDQLTREYANFPEMLIALKKLVLQEAGTVIYDSAIVSTSFLGVLKYVNQHFDEDMDLQQVAAAQHLSANYISQMFRRETGATFTQYLTNLRIAKAKKLLVSETIPISEVAAQIGINDYFYFLKFFKKVVGQTPTQYREQQWQDGKVT